jgi:dTDP-glucose 4,6-dehydratase
VHLAAESHVDRSISNPSGFVRSNILGSHAVLEASRRHFDHMPHERRSKFRLHMVSTDEVFGTLGDDGCFTENSPYSPNSPYSASKASADMLARAWQKSYGLPLIISRSSNNYGPWQHPEKLMPTALAAAMEKRPIPVYGNGNNVRQWLHVEDHVSALTAILERGQPGESYNVGGGTEATNLEVVTALCKAMDQLVPGGAPHADMIRFVTDRPGHDWRYASSGDKIRQALGWHPTISLAEGLFQTASWYLENRGWWQAMASVT